MSEFTSYEEAPQPLTDSERRLLKRMFSDFFEVPAEWKASLRADLERDPPILGTIALGGGGGGAGLLVGEIRAWPFGAVPDISWEFCDGQTVSRSGKYVNLHTKVAAYGYPAPFGPGDGSTTFTLPNLKGKVMVHKDSGDAAMDLVGETGGAKTHTLTEAQLASHRHLYPVQASGGNQTVAALDSFVNNWNPATGVYGQSLATGGDQPHNNLQPFIVIPAIIYLG